VAGRRISPVASEAVRIPASRDKRHGSECPHMIAGLPAGAAVFPKQAAGECVCESRVKHARAHLATAMPGA